jgi:hypothetical protein
LYLTLPTRGLTGRKPFHRKAMAPRAP